MNAQAANGCMTGASPTSRTLRKYCAAQKMRKFEFFRVSRSMAHETDDIFDRLHCLGRQCLRAVGPLR
jgi:hypothetical protein